MSVIEKTQIGPSGNVIGSYTEALGGVAAIVLTILGLARVAPVFLVAIATIAVGAALIVHSVNLIEEFARMLTRSEPVAELGGVSAWSLELLAGVAGVVLGILALLQVAPIELVAIAVISYGGASLLSSASTSRIAHARVELSSDNPVTRRLAGEVVTSSAASQALGGLAAIVLGILALAGFSPVVLVLIALLTLGAIILLNGAALGGAFMTMFGRF
jgi:hypothetical protein